MNHVEYVYVDQFGELGVGRVLRTKDFQCLERYRLREGGRPATGWAGSFEIQQTGFGMIHEVFYLSPIATRLHASHPWGKKREPSDTAAWFGIEPAAANNTTPTDSAMIAPPFGRLKLGQARKMVAIVSPMAHCSGDSRIHYVYGVVAVPSRWEQRERTP